MTLSARARIDGGMVRPSALAVLRLILGCRSSQARTLGCLVAETSSSCSVARRLPGRSPPARSRSDAGDRLPSFRGGQPSGSGRLVSREHTPRCRRVLAYLKHTVGALDLVADAPPGNKGGGQRRVIEIDRDRV